MYFNSQHVTPNMGFTESVNAVLSANFHDSPYSGGGLVTASNLQWLKNQEFAFVAFGYGGWSSEYAYIAAPITAEDSESFGLLVETLNGLSDYPLVDDELYFDMEYAIIQDYILELAEEHSVAYRC